MIGLKTKLEKIMAEETIKIDFKTKVNSLFSKINIESDSYINNVKKEAYSEFTNHGLPTLKHENWKYTNVAFLNKSDFELKDSNNINKEIVDNYKFKNFNPNVLVFVNGKFSNELSDYKENNGIKIQSLNELLNSNDELIQYFYAKSHVLKNNPFTALNTALVNDGICILIDKNIESDEAYHLLHINDANLNANFANHRKLILADTGSKIKIIETVHTHGDNPSFSNSVGEMFIGRNAQIDYHLFQNDSENSYFIGANYIVQEKDSRFNSNTITIDGKFVRNNLTTTLNEENIESNFFGLFMGDKQNLIDNHTFADHAKPHCVSNENYKGILNDKSTGIFNGKILVRKDAQKTNAYQSNKNLLLSDSATINTKPELEIYADDVKCSHGATSGSLDKESIFYLQARGIDFDTAQSLLLIAHANEIIEKITIPELKEEIQSIINKKLEIHH